MPHNSSCFFLDWSPTFLSSSYRISWTSEMPLHTFIDQQPVSTLASWFRWFQMIVRFLKRSPAQHFFSLVVFEKLSRSVSIKLNWFPCTSSWSSLVQLTISNEAKVAVAVERDAIALRISQLSNCWLTRTAVSPDYDFSPLSCRS